MNLINKTNIKEIDIVIEMAKKVMDNPNFVRAIQDNNNFTYTKDLGVSVMSKLFYSDKTVEVKIIYPKYKRTRMIATTFKSKPNQIFLNGYKLNRSAESAVGSIWHEWSHINSFGHGGNCMRWFCNPSKKLKSVPYLVGKLAKRYCK